MTCLAGSMGRSADGTHPTERSLTAQTPPNQLLTVCGQGVQMSESKTSARPGMPPKARNTLDGAAVEDWRHGAACRDEDPVFFPIGNTGPALLQIEDAKAVCSRCDSQAPCLQWALESGQDHGVWGNMPEDERRALKRRAARMRARTA